METSFVVTPAWERSPRAASKALRTSEESASKNNCCGMPRQNFLGFARKVAGLAMLGSWPTRVYKMPVSEATSLTVRASGPAQSNEGESGMIPSHEMRPKVGFSPAMPHKAAGIRMEPPVSVPILP